MGDDRLLIQGIGHPVKIKIKDARSAPVGDNALPFSGVLRIDCAVDVAVSGACRL